MHIKIRGEVICVLSIKFVIPATPKTEMFSPKITRISEFVILHPSQSGRVKSSILTRLKQMHIDSSFPNLGIDTEMSDVHVSSAIIDSNERCCVAMCTFLLTHIIPSFGGKLRKPTKKSFHIFLFDNTEEKVAVRFEGEDSSTYTVTLC